MKRMNPVLTGMVIFAMVSGSFISSCGDRESPGHCSCGVQAIPDYYTTDQITEYLNNMLPVLDERIGNEDDRTSYLMKVQVQSALGDLAGAERTLDEYDLRYQSTGESALLRATMLVCANAHPSQIVSLLQQALGSGVWGMDDDEFWDFVEKSGAFGCLLGNPQSNEFRDFLSQKGKVELPVPEKMLPRSLESDYGDSEWAKDMWKLYLYVGHDNMWLLQNAVKMAEEMSHWVGAITELHFIFLPIAMVLAAQHARIECEDEGCGVVLSWFWFQIFSALFVAFDVDTQGAECRGIKACYPPEHLEVNFDRRKPVRFDDRIKFTASRVGFPAQYMFRFTCPGHRPRETDWLTSNEFETDARWTTKCNDCDVTAQVLSRNTRTGRMCGEGPEGVTYHIYEPDPNMEKITGFTYSDSADLFPCDADFEMKITPIGGRCTSGEGEKWMWVFFIDSRESKHFIRDDGPYSFNPSKICKEWRWVKPGGTLQFRVYAYCKYHERYSTDAWTKIFTIEEDQLWTKE